VAATSWAPADFNKGDRSMRESGANLGHEILFGYRTNEAGFGWTNAVFTVLLDGLPLAGRRAVIAASAIARFIP
jgi:hypothetical protein